MSHFEAAGSYFAAGATMADYLTERLREQSAAAAAERASRLRRRHLFLERGLGGAGLAVTIAAGAFISCLIYDARWRESLSGSEILTVLAKFAPSGSGPTTGPSERPADGTGPDTLATGSIAPGMTQSAND
jgi:hypothetical protein